MKFILFFIFSLLLFASCSKESLNDDLLVNKHLGNNNSSYLSFKIYSEEDGEVFFNETLNDLEVERISGKTRLLFDGTYHNSFRLKNLITLIEDDGYQLDPNNTLILLGYMFAEDNETGIRKDVTNNTYDFVSNESNTGVLIKFRSKCYTHGSTNCSSDWMLQNSLNRQYHLKCVSLK